MMPLSRVEWIIGILAVGVAVGYRWLSRATDRKDGMPPGPPTRLLSGNNHQLQADPRPVFFKYQAYQPQYGDLISIKNATINVIIIQSARIMRELFDKRAAIYSNRPKSEFHSVLNNGDHLIFQRNKQIWKTSNGQLAHHYSTANAQEEFVHIQEAESTQICWEFAANWRRRKKVALARKPTLDASGLGWGDGFGVSSSPVYRRARRNASLRQGVASDRAPSLGDDDDLPEDDGIDRPLLDSLIRYASSVLTSITYGVRAPTYDSPICKGVQDYMNGGSQVKRPGFIPPLDAFPILKYLPDYFSPWRVTARQLTELTTTMYGGMYRMAVKRAEEGRNRDSFANRLHKGKENHGLTDSQVYYLCGVILEGGSDVVAIGITSCIMALLQDPELQRRAQREIDAVCDEYTLPSWKHRESLHYIIMLVKETLRWRPPFPMGVAHALDADDIFEGFLLPSGSTVQANIWAIHQNPERYPKPEMFDPERYRQDRSMMVDSAAMDYDVRDHFAFGAGTRACPGIQLAEQGMYLAIARILWGFRLSVPHGYKLDVSQETGFEGHACRRPKPFPLVATPRSARRMETVEKEMRAAKRHIFSSFGTS